MQCSIAHKCIYTKYTRTKHIDNFPISPQVWGERSKPQLAYLATLASWRTSMLNSHCQYPTGHTGVSFEDHGKTYMYHRCFCKGKPLTQVISLGTCVTLGYVGVMGMSDFPFQWPPPVIPPYQRPPCMQSFHSSTAGWLYNPRMKWFPSLGNKWTPGSTSKWTALEASEPVTSCAFTA